MYWAIYFKDRILDDLTRLDIDAFMEHLKDKQISASTLGNLLAMTTGLRQGEISALRIEDLDQNCIYIRHSWNDIDGLKVPKNSADALFFYHV